MAEDNNSQVFEPGSGSGTYMKVICYGAGAVGSLIGYALASQGHDVCLIGRDPHVTIVNKNGLKCISGSQQGVASVAAAANIYEVLDWVKTTDAIIISVKGYDTDQAADALADLVSNKTTLITVQNGIGNEEKLAKRFSNSIISAALTHSTELVEPGVVQQRTTRGGIGFAAVSGQVPEWLPESFRKFGWRVSVYSKYLELKWSKLLLNIICNASCAILNLPPADVISHPKGFLMERMAFLEALKVMRALKLNPVKLPGFHVPAICWLIQFSPAFLLRRAMARTVGGSRGDKMPSLLMDISKGKSKTEVDQLNGAIALAGTSLGISVPINEGLSTVLKLISEGKLERNYYAGRIEKLFNDLLQQSLS